MTLNCVKTETQTSNASCLGEYCSLIHTLDPHRDLFNNDQEVQNGNGKNKSDKVQKVEGRERAFSVIKRLLTASELERLEENGKLIHLRIPQRIRSFILRDVPNESIMMSRKEHRLAFLELIKAEDVSLSQSIEVTDRSFNEKDGSSSSRPRLERTRSLTNKGSTLNTVPTCEMCYHVYRLLSHTRCLLSDEFTSTPLGKIELEAFGLNELMYQSTQTKTKTPKKRNISSKKNDNVNTQSDIVLRLQSSESMHEAKHERKQNVIESKNMAHLSSSSLINTPTTKTNKNKKSDRTKMTGPKKKNSNIIPASIKNVSHKRNSNGTAEEDKSSTIFHYDAKTSFTYTVLQNQSESPSSIDNVSKRSHQQAYNMVVCHDIFDTQERMKIFLSSFIEQNPQCKVLLWNYPGQAFTTFLPTQSLNNEFHAKCLNKLLIHVGAEGTNEFDSRKPFYLLGHGHGGSVACSHVAKCKYIPGLRGICLINPLIFIDTHFASVMHDCRNVFSCSPETRPDLPLYFYSRFIFSQEYLQKVSTPLALNLYTAVHNPISVQGRISLCNGVLNNIDLRESIQQLNVPIISVHGNHSELVRPIHAASFLQGREPCSTIHRALDQKGMKTTVLVMTEGGHELLQEKKKMVLALIEELLTGYHDVKKSQRQNKKPMRVISSDSWGAIVHQSTKLNDPSNVNGGSQKQDERIEHREVNQGNKKVIKASNTERIRTTTQKEVNIVLDPQNPSFERQQNFVYKPGTGAIYPSCDEYVKPKEYMSWRLKRNKKRLSRFQKAAKIIQGSLRVYMAKTMIVRLKRQRSALNIQRCFRGMLGRRIFKELLKELWAAQLVQRAYRGAMGRRTSYYRRMSIQAQINIARVWRGHVARKLVNKIVTYRNVAAINLQSLWRRCMAIDLAKYMRGRKHGSTTIQRIYRGYRGRRKADMERDKYIFSKSQSMGIELGRQMLTEHKHHATRLQSELSILEKERTSLESKVDVITNDLNTFQQQAGKLEKTMHEISLVEAQKRNNIAAQHVLREKKV
jgi:pimeloyl-ACP methyl ester carboxylesterase